MITPEEPKVAATGKYSITQAAKVLGLHTNTILRHTKEGRIRCSVRRSTGRKVFTGYELMKYWRTY